MSRFQPEAGRGTCLVPVRHNVSDDTVIASLGLCNYRLHMRKHLSRLAAAAAAIAASAQPVRAVDVTAPQVHSVRLSGWCEPVTDARARSSRDGGVYRIRSGGALSSAANRQTILVEPGGSLVYVGRGSSIYIENGGYARIVGDANRIVMQARAQVSSSGSNAVSVVGAFDVGLNPNAGNCR